MACMGQNEENTSRFTWFISVKQCKDMQKLLQKAIQWVFKFDSLGSIGWHAFLDSENHDEQNDTKLADFRPNFRFSGLGERSQPASFDTPGGVFGFELGRRRAGSGGFRPRRFQWRSQNRCIDV